MEILRKIDQNEEDKIKAMREEQRKLHLIPTPICYLDIEVIDKNGEITTKYSDRSKSWVRNFYNYCVMTQLGISSKILGTSFGAGYLNMKDTLGSIKHTSSDQISYNATPSNTTPDIWWRASGSSVINGIVIGTGETAESLDNYVLGAIIAEGTGSGQMNYSAMIPSSVVWDGTGKTMTSTVERTAVNNSGSSITVKETGLIARLILGGSYGNFLMARDVLASPVAVAHESQIKVTYTVQIAYPS